MSQWKTDAELKTKVYKEHQAKFCDLLLTTARLVDPAATASLTIDEANESGCMRRLVHMVADPISTVALPSELLKVLRSTIDKRRAACRWYDMHLPGDERTLDHLDFILVLEDMERQLVAKAKADAARTLTLSSSAPIQAPLSDVNRYAILYTSEPSTPTEQASPKSILDISLPVSSSKGIEESDLQIPGQTIRYEDKEIPDVLIVGSRAWEVPLRGPVYPASYEAERRTAWYWQTAGAKGPIMPHAWPNRQYVISTSGWLVAVYESDPWLPPSKADFMTARRAAEVLELELAAEAGLIKEYEEFCTGSYEGLDCFHSQGLMDDTQQAERSSEGAELSQRRLQALRIIEMATSTRPSLPLSGMLHVWKRREDQGSPAM